MLNRFNFKIILNLWFCFNFAMILLAFNPSDILNSLPKEKACMEKNELKCGPFIFTRCSVKDFSKTYQEFGILE